MNKELQKLLKQINDKKNEVKSLVNDGKLDKASRQKLLAFMSVKELYDNRDKYRSDTKTLSAAVSSMLLKEIYGGAAE